MSRRNRPSQHVNHERWLVSYADFITLLFAFFVVLFASSQVDKRKVGRLSMAMQEAFQQMGIFQTANSRTPLVTNDPEQADRIAALENARGITGKGKLPSPFETVMGIQPAPGDLSSVQKQLSVALDPQIQRREVVLKPTREGLVVSLREIGFFNSGSADVRAASEDAVRRIADVLRALPNNVRIEGHTDNVPIHNSQFASNWELSTSRATEMIRRFITVYKLPPERLSAAGYAEFHPVAENSTPEGRAHNRRVDIVILDIAAANSAAPVEPGFLRSCFQRPFRPLFHFALELRRQSATARRWAPPSSSSLMQARRDADNRQEATKTMTPTLRELIRERVERLNSIPTVPAIIRPLLFYLERPVDEVEVQRIVDLVSCDESIAAQCLRVANSALYGHAREVKSVHGAVVVLGVRQVREILLSCSLLNLLPRKNWVLDPVIFWEHSLACAIVSRSCALSLGARDPERAYLAGLLHDLGEIVNMISFQEEFNAAAHLARAEMIPLHEAEKSALGFTHCDTGKILAEHWRLSEDFAEVAEHHHECQQAKLYPALVALVSLSDRICHLHDLGFEMNPALVWNLVEDPAWGILTRHFPRLAQTEPARFLSEMGEFTLMAGKLVRSILRP